MGLLKRYFTPYDPSPFHSCVQAFIAATLPSTNLVMENLYVRGVALAGAFNLLPGRSTARALIPDIPELGYLVIACVLIWALVPLLRRHVTLPTCSVRRGAQ